MYTEITRCRSCGNQRLTQVLSLGRQYLASSFVATNEGNPLARVKFPLTLVLCDPGAGGCGLVQLKETVQRDLLYREYFYRSQTNPMMHDALREIVTEASARVEIAPGDAVLDIGCNDGTLLGIYPPDLKRCGIDPARNVSRSHLDPAIATAVDYFNAPAALALSGGSAFKIVTSIAMFYDLEDPHSFIEEVKSILAPDGIWCLQLSYIRDVIEQMSFFDICHEHLMYYSLRTLSHLLALHGLTVVDASTNGVNGGSMRLFVAHDSRGMAPTPNLARLLEEEAGRRLDDPATFAAFAEKIEALKRSIKTFLADARAAGRLVTGLGASTKGNVLLQYFGISKDDLPFITDRNPEKVGLRTLGTDIEVVAEECARAKQPFAQLVLIWFFKEELLRREQAYLEQGGRLLFPMPTPHVVTASGEYALEELGFRMVAAAAPLA
jgi:NDP-4-keto-2,6-dideoxyhexose 3-C-methyltransferase